MSPDSPWKIDLAMKARQNTDDKVRKENLQQFINFQRAFPGLAVKLRYKVALLRTAKERAGGLSEFHHANLCISASDDVSLHSAAVGCLLGESRAADFGEVLRASEVSLLLNVITV